MAQEGTRRELLARLGAAAAGMAVTTPSFLAESGGRADELSRKRVAPRVIIARDEALTRESADRHRERLQKLLDASMQRLTSSSNAASAWKRMFRPGDRVGVKVNTLGLSTNPAVVSAVVDGLQQAGVRDQDIIVWDRFDVELERAGFRLNRSGPGVKCRGTDASRAGSGYQDGVEVSGSVGSCFSRIVAEEVDALICVPVLKDHNLAGVSLGMKNFYGAIHNPNKYHDDNCDPYIVDVVSHRFIAPRWRLTVCDGTRAQFHNGPGRSAAYLWAFGGLVISADFVAADAVAAGIIEEQRMSRGLRALADERRPPRHIATAGARGLGESDIGKIERIEV
ncbi:MAG: DUF362 domain-containing protein [Vicinamibacteria bacterium]|nr:DUF362 domain-containing protein [Vicinamibacteria bacterium]